MGARTPDQEMLVRLSMILSTEERWQVVLLQKDELLNRSFNPPLKPKGSKFGIKNAVDGSN
jgi:hypothetical protein